LFRHIQPQVVQALSEAAGKIRISFGGWMIAGGNREFFGIVASFADAFRGTRDLPIYLLQLAGAYTSEAILSTIIRTLKVYSVTRSKLGYFVLDNAANNDTVIAALSRVYNLGATY
jgi:hypothetical protein